MIFSLTTAQFIILSLAIWRLTFMLVKEKGPYDILEKLRHFLGIVRWEELTAEEQIDILSFGGEYSDYIPKTMLAKLFSCIGCLSVSVAAIIFLPVFIIAIIQWSIVSGPVIALVSMIIGFIIEWLALSTGAIAVETIRLKLLS